MVKKIREKSKFSILFSFCLFFSAFLGIGGAGCLAAGEFHEGVALFALSGEMAKLSISAAEMNKNEQKKLL